MNTHTKSPGDLQATIDKLGLLVSNRFIPFSQSRHAKAEHPDLNWEVTLYTLSPLDGQRCDILTTLYSAGSAHCPSYRQPGFGKRTVEAAERDTMVAWECEHGGIAQGVRYPAGGERQAYGGKPGTLQPKALDVIYSLVMDSDVLDAGGFESWAQDLGYDVDSRTAEKIYQTCLELALKLRVAIGDAGISALREAFQDY